MEVYLLITFFNDFEPYVPNMKMNLNNSRKKWLIRHFRISAAGFELGDQKDKCNRFDRLNDVLMKFKWCRMSMITCSGHLSRTCTQCHVENARKEHAERKPQTSCNDIQIHRAVTDFLHIINNSSFFQFIIINILIIFLVQNMIGS